MEAQAPANTGLPPTFEERRAVILARIGRLERLANRGLYAMAAFIAMSIGAVNDFSFLPSLTQQMRSSLGKPPSPQAISIALVVYVFSAIILSLSRMMEGSGKTGGFAQLAYLGAFYVFYHFCGGITEYFWAVFAAGMTILLLESFQLRNHCQEQIRQERETLALLERSNATSALRPPEELN